MIDASVAAKWYLRDEDHVEPSLSLLRSYESGAAMLMAPHFIRYEVARSLLRAGQQRRISEEDAREQVQRFLDLGIHLPGDPDSRLLAAHALSRSLRVGFYDALYLALAEEIGSGFVTADVELYRRVRDGAPYATWIGDLFQ